MVSFRSPKGNSYQPQGDPANDVTAGTKWEDVPED
ncbi:MAG: rubredoxin [Desulfobacterales bacterium]|nr:rubredoxin [Desulfobacterales bacterium]MDP7417624.1 rubredoxin [Desulfobacterales bacterium]HJO63175.1 rubredoxin [Desulfobacterales bacterium]